jgi:hypothetical protein
MRTQTKETENKQTDQGLGTTMKHDWLVENADGRKTLHDLYFETGSLPHQQPKVKPKEPEKAKTAGRLAQSTISGLVAIDSAANYLRAASSRPWLKRAAYVSAAVILSLGAYRAMPKGRA